MSPIERAIAIIECVIKIDFKDWVYEVEGPRNYAWTRQPGWGADLTYLSAQTGNVATDHEAFLGEFRSASAAYKIELWVDGAGSVLFKTSEDDVSFIELKHGQWETQYFGLPSPTAERRLDYV